MSENEATFTEGNAVVYDDPAGGNVEDDVLNAIVSDLEGESPKDTQKLEEKPEIKKEKKEESKHEPIDPPSFMNLEEREAFSKLPREAQETFNRVAKGFQKTVSQTAEERKALEPWMNHIRMLQSDPNYRQHVFGYGQKPEPQQQAPKPPEDPLEAFKWEVRQEVIKELAPQLAPLVEKQKALEAQRQIDSVASQVRTDPMYQEVQNKIVDFVNSQPPGMRDSLYQLLDSNPQAYMEYYQHFRSQVGEKKPSDSDGLPAGEKKSQERAPYLERGGAVSGDAATLEAKKREKAKALRREMRQNPNNMRTVGDYLEISGLIDHLL